MIDKESFFHIPPKPYPGGFLQDSGPVRASIIDTGV